MQLEPDWFSLLDEILIQQASLPYRIIADVPHDWIAAYAECHPEKTEAINNLASPFFVPPQPDQNVETLIRSLLLGRELWKPGKAIRMPSRWLGMSWIKPLLEQFGIPTSATSDASLNIERMMDSDDPVFPIGRLRRAESLSVFFRWMGAPSLGGRIRWTWEHVLNGLPSHDSMTSLESALRANLPAEPDENAFVVFFPSSTIMSWVSVSQVPAPGFVLFNETGESVPFQKTETENEPSILFQSKSKRMGFQTFRFKPVETVLDSTRLTAGRFFLENDWLRVDVRPNGLVDITDKSTRHRFRGLNAPSISGKSIKPSSVRLSLVESGPLRAVIRIRMRLKPPGSSRHGSTGVIKIWSTVRLGLDDRHVEFETKIENPFDETASMRFPTYCQTRQSRALVGFGQTTYHHDRANRNGPDESRVHHGVIWISDENRGCALVTGRPGHFSLKLDARRTVNLNLGSGESGRNAWKYGFVPFDPKEEPDGRIAWSVFESLTRPSIAFKGLALPDHSPCIRIEQDGILASLKEAEDGLGMILRLWNPAVEKMTTRIELQPAVAKSWICRTDETNLKDLPIVDGNIELTVEPCELATIRFE